MTSRALIGAPDELRAAGPVRLGLGAAGIMIIGVGGVLLIIGAPDVRAVVSAGGWLLVPAVVSDLILMPVATIVGRLIGRIRRPSLRHATTVAAALTVFILLIGWPFIGGFGRHPDNPSLLDRGYRLGALTVLAVVWVGCLVAGVLAGPARRAASSRRGPGPAPDPAPAHTDRPDSAGQGGGLDDVHVPGPEGEVSAGGHDRPGDDVDDR